jgi:hypothetical protein
MPDPKPPKKKLVEMDLTAWFLGELPKWPQFENLQNLRIFTRGLVAVAEGPSVEI